MSTDLDRLQTFHAADGVPDPDARAAARAALLERIEEAAAQQRPVGRCVRAAAPRPRRRRLLAGGLGLAGAGAAALALALVSGLGSGGVQPPAATAAELLRRAADVAAGGPDVVLRPGQYWYTRSESTTRTTYGDRPPFSFLSQMRRESWIGRDGGGRVRQYAVGKPRFVSPRDRENWIASGRPALAGGVMDVPIVQEDGAITEKTYYLGAIGLTYDEMRALPTDVETLYARVALEARRWATGNGRPLSDAPHQMFTIVGDMLRETPMPPALRAAFFRVAARIPGVELVGETTDAAGRPGVAVALGDARRRAELIFDARTAELLGERSTWGADPAFISAYLESGAVDSVKERP